MPEPNPEPVVLVGVDGSQGSLEALRWAARHGEQSGAAVHAVLVWQLPEIYAYTPRDYATDARHTLEHAVETALGPGAQTKLSLDVFEGHPAEELVRMGRDAQLLVLGRHGHGAFAGKQLGSVNHHCVQHATCPVVVVP